MVISLGWMLPSSSCSLPETRKKTGRFPSSEDDIGLCLALLQPGVAWPRHYCRRRWSLTPPFHPCSCERYVSVARSGRFFRRIPAPGVTRRFALWRADFPRSPKTPRPSDQPEFSSYSQVIEASTLTISCYPRTLTLKLRKE